MEHQLKSQENRSLWTKIDFLKKYYDGNINWNNIIYCNNDVYEEFKNILSDRNIDDIKLEVEFILLLDDEDSLNWNILSEICKFNTSEKQYYKNFINWDIYNSRNI